MGRHGLGAALEARPTHLAGDAVRVDLHCHSCLSDGDLSPELLVRRLAAAGVSCAALTDHNTLAGQERFGAAAERSGVRSVTGLEMDATSPDGPVHVLAYGFDARDPSLAQALRTVRRPLVSTARRWVGRMQRLGTRAPSERAAAGPNRAWARAQALPGTAEAIGMIHEAGGLAFLAHPLAALPSVSDLEALLDVLQAQGLDGMEVFYKPCPAPVQEKVLAVAVRRRLMAVAGSDYHGSHHAFGASPGVDLPREHWDRLAGRLGLDVPPARHVGDGGRLRCDG